MDLKTKENKPCCKIQFSDDKSIVFYVPNGPCLFRASTIKTKEPWTLEWIDTFDPSDILWDVGANIGVFTLYASVIKGIKVFAFEPEAANYRVLNENIRINRVYDKVRAYCVALSNQSKFGDLKLSVIETASSNHQLFNMRNPAFVQGCVSYTLDDLSISLGTPNHLKIDVDGIEQLVLDGGVNKVLPNVKSIVVEICDRLDDRSNIKNYLVEQGFTWHSDFAKRSTRSIDKFTIAEHLFTR